MNNFSNDAREFGVGCAKHLNRLREEKRIDPCLFAGFSLVKNQTKGDLILYVGLPKIYSYDDFDLTKENRKHILGRTYETPIDGSLYGNRIHFMLGIGAGFIYYLNDVIAIGVEHKIIFTLRDDFNRFVQEGGRYVKDKKDLFHYAGVVLRLQKVFIRP